MRKAPRRIGVVSCHGLPCGEYIFQAEIMKTAHESNKFCPEVERDYRQLYTVEVSDRNGTGRRNDTARQIWFQFLMEGRSRSEYILRTGEEDNAKHSFIG